MGNRNPVILTGPRSPGQLGDPSEQGVSAQPSPTAAAGVAAKPGVRRYGSASSDFRVSLIDEKNRVVDNVVIPGRRLMARFSDGAYETSDPEIIRLLDASAPFKSKRIWDADALQAAAEQAAEEAAIKTVEGNPALMARIAERLQIKGKGLDSFKLDPPKAGSEGDVGESAAQTS